MTEILKNIGLFKCEQVIYHFKARDLEIPNVFCKLFKFHYLINALMIFAKHYCPLSREIEIFREKNYLFGISR